MSAHQLGGTDYVPGSIYDATVAHSSRLLYARTWLVSPTATVPDRETLIQAFMSILDYTPTRKADGSAVMGKGVKPSRERAERSVDAALGIHHEEQAA